MQLPSALIQSLQGVTGFDENSFTAVHQSGEQITSVRLNPAKSIDNTSLDIDAKIPWTNDGYYLKGRPSFTVDPLFHGGAYYVQEASSMFLEKVLQQTVDLKQPLHILDLCAAPGGKSTLIQSAISEESLLVSNEVIKSRAAILCENITKWGAANVVVTNNDPKDFQRLPSFFDVIVVDAPCSGSGLFRRDPNAINEWSEENVTLCSMRQQRILADVMPALKPGGILIYSTCSYSAAEDEAIMDWLVADMQMKNKRLEIDPSYNIVETLSNIHHAYGYRFYPDKLKGEGFFIAAFEKTGEAPFPESSQKKQKNTGSKKTGDGITKKEIDIIRSYLDDAAKLSFIKQDEDIIAFPAAFETDIQLLKENLYIKKAGVRIGAIAKNDLIPDHELALSTIIASTVRRVDIDKETALNYLRRAEIFLSVDYIGWTLVTFEQIPLGWVKILPNRVNNYYPKEWRILNK